MFKINSFWCNGSKCNILFCDSLGVFMVLPVNVTSIN